MKMKKGRLPVFSSQNYVVLVVILFLAILFCYYFLIFLPAQENKIITNRVRALQQIEKNFKEKYRVYRKISEIKGKPFVDFKKFDQFFQSLQKEESFQGYIVFKDTNLIKQDVPGEILRVPASIYYNLATDHKKDYQKKYFRINLESRSPEKSDTPRVFEAGTKVKLGSIDYRLFSTNFKLNGGKSWTVYALVNQEEFNAEKKQIPFFTTILLFGLLIILIFSLPILKFYYMNDFDQIQVKDVLATPLAFLFCIAVVVLVFLLTCKYYLYELPRVDSKLKEISYQMNSLLKSEIDTLHELTSDLKKSDSLPDDGNNNSISLIKDNQDFSESVNFNSYPWLRTVYWLNENGKRVYELTTLTDKNDSVNANFKDREYFQRVKEGNAFDYKGTPDAFYLQSILSYTTGEAISTFSIPVENSANLPDSITDLPDSTNLPDSIKDLPDSIKDQRNSIKDQRIKVMGISTTLQSLTRPFLPGYGFIIIDKKGEVLYHHDIKKNLRENFLLETDKDNEIRAALASQDTARVYSSINYHQKNYRVSIHSLENAHLPGMYLVVTYNKSYLQTAFLNILIFALAGFFLTALLASLQLIVFVFFHKRSGKLKRNTGYIHWLRPYTKPAGKDQEDNETLKCIAPYYYVTGIIIFYLIVLLIFVNPACTFIPISFPDVIASFVSAMVGSYSFAYLLLYLLPINNWYKERAEKNQLKEEDRVYFRKEKKRAKNVFGFSLLISFLTVLFFCAISERGYLLGIWFFMNAVPFIFFKRLVLSGSTQKLPLPKFMKRGKRINWLYRHHFSFLVFTYLSMASVASISFMYQTFYLQEMNIWRAYDKYHFVNQWIKRHEELSGKLNKLLGKDEVKNFNDFFIPHESCGSCLKKEASLEASTWETTPTKEWYRKLRPKNSDLLQKTSVFANGEQKLTYNSLDSCAESYLDGLLKDPPGCELFYSEDKPTGKSYGQAASEANILTTFIKHDLAYWIFFTVALAIFSVVVYRMISFTIQRVFGVDIFKTSPINQLNNYLIKSSHIKGDHFYISIPFADGSNLIKEIKKAFNGNNNAELKGVEEIDLATDLSDEMYCKTCKRARRYQKKRVVLKHFSYHLEDMELNLRHLALLEIIISRGNSVTIISKLTPLQIINNYEELLESFEEREEKEKLKNQIQCWKDIFSCFSKCFFSELTLNEKRERLQDICTVKELIDYELGPGKACLPFLRALDSSKLHIQDDSRDNGIKEEVILKIQSLAQPFYLSLWNTCSREEKYMLYDFADDGYMNTQNKRIVMQLMDKGLLFYDGALQIMNESFRNFILTDIKKSEALQMKKELRREGSWSLYSTIVFLFIISLLVFVVFAQENLVNQFLAIITGIAASLPYIFRFSSALFSEPGKNSG